MMRFKVLAYLLGTLFLYLGIVMLLPIFWVNPADKAVAFAFIWSAAISISAGLLLKWRRKPPDNIFIKESFAFVALAWIVSAMLGSLPYLFSGTFGSFTNAFFESMSGFTTTGATVIEDIEVISKAVLFWRSLTQWLGGMGIIVLFVAMLPRLGVRNIYLLKAEVPGPGPERIVPRIAETAKRLWMVYLAISAAEFIFLLLSGLSVFDSLTHTFTTMPTGGFSTYNESIAALNNVRAEAVIIVFMLLAGGNFTLYYNLWLGKWRTILKDAEFRFYLLVVVISMIAATIAVLPHYGVFTDAARNAAFQVVSIVTTTGYVTSDYDIWPPMARILIFFLMFLGGSGGSTGGAMKQIRILILIKYAIRELNKLLHPSAVIPLRVGGKIIPEGMVQNILGFSLLYAFIFLISSIVMGAMGMDYVSALSVSASCLGNVGPALGVLGPLHTYADLPAIAKIFLSLIMLLGRLEIYTIMVFLLPEARSTRLSM